MKTCGNIGRRKVRAGYSKHGLHAIPFAQAQAHGLGWCLG